MYLLIKCFRSQCRKKNKNNRLETSDVAENKPFCTPPEPLNKEYSNGEVLSNESPSLNPLICGCHVCMRIGNKGLNQDGGLGDNSAAEQERERKGTRKKQKEDT